MCSGASPSPKDNEPAQRLASSDIVPYYWSLLRLWTGNRDRPLIRFTFRLNSLPELPVNPEKVEILRKGKRLRVGYARTLRGTMPAREFLESRSVPKKDLAQILRWIEYFSDSGEIANTEKFKKLSGNLWEFKSYQVRLAGFWHDGDFLLTHGWIKKQDRADRSQIERGERIREEHLAAVSKQKGS